MTFIHSVIPWADALSSALGAMCHTKEAEIPALITKESIFCLGIHGRRLWQPRKIVQCDLWTGVKAITMGYRRSLWNQGS